MHHPLVASHSQQSHATLLLHFIPSHPISPSHPNPSHVDVHTRVACRLALALLVGRLSYCDHGYRHMVLSGQLAIAGPSSAHACVGRSVCHVVSCHVMSCQSCSSFPLMITCRSCHDDSLPPQLKPHGSLPMKNSSSSHAMPHTATIMYSISSPPPHHMLTPGQR